MIGWYVHHHGAGHRTRLLATCPHLGEVVGLSSLPAPADGSCPWVELPLDRDREPRDETAGGTLHWVPLHHAGLRERMAVVADWIRRHRPRLMVVDVSVEVALLARLLGVPTVLIAQRGTRTDAAHRLAYAQAAAVAAPWTLETHRAGDGPPEDRLRFTGAISRFDGVRSFAPAAPGGDVLLLLGEGGHEVTADDVRAAAAASGRRWHVAGALRADGPGVVDHGPHAAVGDLLDRCSVVVGHAGANVVGEVAAARRPFVCLPQSRPFGEQRGQADALRRLGVAEVRDTWPGAPAWPGVLAAAEARDAGRWARLHDGRGAERLAEVVLEAAA